MIFLAFNRSLLKVFYGIKIVVFYQFETLLVTGLRCSSSYVVVVSSFAQFDWFTTLSRLGFSCRMY